jgi:hypothetical protein
MISSNDLKICESLSNVGQLVWAASYHKLQLELKARPNRVRLSTVTFGKVVRGPSCGSLHGWLMLWCSTQES